jgi:hypothetical protein
MSQQACIFCERAKPLVTITKEHLFSRWVDKVLTPEMLGPDRTFERTTVGPDGVPATRTWQTEVVAAIEAAVVCEDCNGGWMSDLDGQVRQLLEPMMLGKPRTLAPGEQQTIATWAAMKSMVMEYFWGSGPAVLPQSARTFVFRQQWPPESMQIRIAAVESQGQPAAIRRRVYQLSPNASGSADPPGFGVCSTIVLDCFVVQTYATSMASPVPSRGRHGQDYLVINPPVRQDIRWPPPQPLDDAGLDRFTHPLRPITGD